MLSKQPGWGNVVTQFLPNESKFKAEPMQKRRPVRNAWLFIVSLMVLVCGEASMLSDSIRKMFLFVPVCRSYLEEWQLI